MVVNGQSAIALQTELAAMQQIASVLESLDPSTRARVLQWVAQRTQDAMPVKSAAAPRPLAVVPPRAAAEPAISDEALSMATLEDLFRTTSAGAPEASAACEPVAQPVTGLLHDFVVEFQNIARDWNVACAEQADRAADQRASSAA